MTIESGRVIYLSKYCGEEKPSLFSLQKSEWDELDLLQKEIGFTDTVGMANLRKQDGTIYVFDTPKDSFASGVHEKIDAFMQKHDAILASLQSK